MSYETERVSVRALLWVAVATFGLMAVCLGAVLLWQVLMWGPERASAPARPDPSWEVPAATLKIHGAIQRARLHGYAWVDREAGVVRIPIERAMELVAKERAP